jgi:serine/threonine-protein kinase HipA
MDRELLVYIDLDKKPLLVGRLWTRLRKGKESATFEYDNQWLNNPIAFSLEPAMTLGPGPYHTQAGKALFGALGDSAPDRWGRVLMRRAERRRAEQAKGTPQTLGEIDFLLMVDDEARQGALRFAESKDGPFLRHSAETRIPPLIELPRLLTASERFEDEHETAEDIRLLLAPGSSLGGARPKASVRERNGMLAIAKFPHKTDQMQAVLWEAVALKLAASAGLTVPVWRIHAVAKRSVLISRRFDRDGARRIPFLSAMSMLGA